MKPIHLNLAARPYRDYRALYAVVVASSLLIAFLLITNVETYLRYVHETRTTRGEIEKLQEETTREQQRAVAATQKIAATDVETLAAQTKFINARLAERAFSWSELLSVLEQTLPDDVRLLTITPAFNPDGTVTLDLALQGKTSDSMIRTLERLMRNPQFTNPFPSTDTATADGSNFNVSAGFMPTIARVVPR